MRSGMTDHYAYRVKEPLRGHERVEFARIALEEAVALMVKYPEETVYRVAVGSRWRELDELHASMERVADREHARPRALDDVGGPVIVLCPNCRRTVVHEDQHKTGLVTPTSTFPVAGGRFMCKAKGALR